MLMVQLFIIILSVRRIDVEECARTVGVAYSIGELTRFVKCIIHYSARTLRCWGALYRIAQYHTHALRHLADEARSESTQSQA